MSTRLRAFPLFAAVATALAACGDVPTLPGPSAVAGVGALTFAQSEAAGTYILNAAGTSLPADLATSIASSGGTLTSAFSEAGVAIATSDDPGFAAKAARIRGIGQVGPDIVLQFTNPHLSGDAMSADSAVDEVSGKFGSNESFRALQWAPDAVNAPAAWDAGARGRGARVAIVDGGIADRHIDIAPNLDAKVSTSFVPKHPFNTDVGSFWHGTHVAGIVAAAANGRGTVGIAPEATIIGVKVLDNGLGSFAAVLSGIVYAALSREEGGAGADIINLSLGAPVQKNGASAHLLNAVSRVVNFARQRGALVVAAAGNDAVDLDHSANVIFTPAQSGTTISVSATGPFGFARGATDFDRPASYTNFGQKAIELAGPGGDFVFDPKPICTIKTPIGAVTTNCWVFDMVLSPSFGTGTYAWAAGTSMAAPAVSGVAALVVGKYGRMDPAHLETILRQSADDLGKPGNDDFYGKGRVNALRAIQ